MFWIEGFGICHDCGSSIEDLNTIFVLRCTGKKKCILTDYCVFEKDRVLGEMRVIAVFSTRYSTHFLEAIRQKLALILLKHFLPVFAAPRQNGDSFVVFCASL